MVYKDSAGKEIHEGDSLMDLTPGFVGEISEVFLDEDEGELAVNQDGTTIYLYEIDTEVSNQCLVIKRFPSSSVATNYVPDWNDMFAKDWMVL